MILGLEGFLKVYPKPKTLEGLRASRVRDESYGLPSLACIACMMRVRIFRYVLDERSLNGFPGFSEQ